MTTLKTGVAILRNIDWQSKYIQCNNEFTEYKQKVLDAINKLRKFMDKQKGVMGEDGFTYIPYADTMLFLDKIDKELELGGIKWQKTSAIKKCKSTDH